MRVAIHDYAGHPFQFELSRELAKRGHVVRHFFYADDPGPKGPARVGPGDPSGFSIEAIRIRWRYSKDKILRRYVGDRLYAVAAARRVAAFRPDVVISGNTPLDVQRALQRAAMRSGAHFTFWIQDFLGVGIQRSLRGRWLGLGDLIARYYVNLERRLLLASESIVLISPDFDTYLPPPVQGSSKVHVIRNWGALGLISPRPKANAWAIERQLQDKFVFMYTGTLGMKHDPQLLLDLCAAFKGDDDVRIVVVATGVNAEALMATNRASPRDNLVMLPLQPAEVLSDVLGTADVLIALLESDAAEFSVPSKILNYLCAERTILLSAPAGNLSVRVLDESAAGVWTSAVEAGDFVRQARRLREDGANTRRRGLNGRRYAEQHFDIEVIADRFERACGLSVEPARQLDPRQSPPVRFPFEMARTQEP